MQRFCLAIQVQEDGAVRHRGERGVSTAGASMWMTWRSSARCARTSRTMAAGLMFNTGSTRLPKPSVGSWVTYGLGSENQNLPAFIACCRRAACRRRICGRRLLPGNYQGTSVNTRRTRRLTSWIREHQKQIHPYAARTARKQLDSPHWLNEVHSQNLQKDAQTGGAFVQALRTWPTRCKWRQSDAL